jgi:hypothetical protein
MNYAIKDRCKMQKSKKLDKNVHEKISKNFKL